jgi:hypothetical protein
MTRLVPIGRLATAEPGARIRTLLVATEPWDASIPIFRRGLAHSI